MTRRNRNLDISSCVAPSSPWEDSPWKRLQDELEREGNARPASRRQEPLPEPERDWQETEREWD